MPSTSTQYPVPSTQYPVPSTQYSVPSTQYPVPSTQYPVPSTSTSTQYSVPISVGNRLSHRKCWADGGELAFYVDEAALKESSVKRIVCEYWCG